MFGRWMTLHPRAPLALLALALLPACASLGGGRNEEADAARRAPMQELAVEPTEFLREAQGIFVVVDLDVNRLHLVDGPDTLWSAPVGTGTGLRLKGDDGEWHFSTPQGVFQIQYKEELPVWYLPDWYFVEKGLPIPPESSSQRKVEGQLGVAAVYLGEEIAIHGTDKPELLGQRVSHGCIRLANEYALRLFHNVQVGTPVVVVGGEHLEDVPPGETTDPGKASEKNRRDPFGGVPTERLLAQLERQLEGARAGSGEWVPVASRLITRGLKDDAIALRGVLALAGKGRSDTVNREYSTFLADAFSRGGLRTVVSLARIEKAERDRAARAIVEATMALHAGPLDAQSAPWPTVRVPATRLGPDGRAGWEALRAAETAFRARVGRVAEESAS